VAVAGAFAIYLRRWRRARAEGGSRAAGAWRLAAFSGGLALALVALVSPVDRLGEQLLTVHMAQHLLVADLASILLLLGLTKVILRPATRRLQRVEAAAGPLAHPAFAVFLYVAAMGTWHIPAMYDAALEHPRVHVLEHLSFAAAGGLYWWHLVSPIRSRLRLGGLGPVYYMVSAKLLVGAVGIVLTFSPTVLYDFYAGQPTFWGLSHLEDQSVAGMVMALEQSLVMGVALVWLFMRMLAESEREQHRAEQLEPAG